MFWKKPKISSDVNPIDRQAKPSSSSWWGGKKESKRVSGDSYPQESDVGLFYQDIYSQVRSIVPRGAIFEGNLVYNVPVKLEGEFRGDLVSTSDIIIAPGSVVHGRIECQSFYSFGDMHGKVQAERTVIYPQAKVTADISCHNLSFGSGAVFEGKCRMS